MNKLSRTEFGNLATIFLKFFQQAIENQKQMDEKNRKEAEKLVDLTYFYIKNETPFALMAGLWLAEIALEESSEAEKKQKFPQLGNQTIGEFIKKTRQRLKKHCEASGYVKNASYNSIKGKMKGVEAAYKNEEYRKKLLIYFSGEDENVVLGAKEYMEKTTGLFPNHRISGEMGEKYNFVLEDIIGRVERASKAELKAELEKSEQNNISSPPTNQTEPNSTPASNENQPTRANNSPPTSNSADQSVNSPVVSNKQEIENLEKEKTRLEQKAKELSRELANNQNIDEKKIKEEILAVTRQLIQEKEEQLKKMGASLPKEQSVKPEKDWKINLAIGLGITAVILLLLLVIVNISRKRKD